MRAPTTRVSGEPVARATYDRLYSTSCAPLATDAARQDCTFSGDTMEMMLLNAFPVSPAIAALPKADLHVHAETDARLDRVLAQRDGRPPFAWRNWVGELVANVPPGMERLQAMAAACRFEPAVIDTLDADPQLFVARVADLLGESVADGALYVEVIFGAGTVRYPDFMPLFRAALHEVQQRYPFFHASALIAASLARPEVWEAELLPACLEAARDGLAGINIIPEPYDREADWQPIYRWAERAAAAGLGISAHAGEFSAANILPALRVPGLSRLGHLVYAASDPRLLEAVARSGVTAECCLTCNVVLGATPSYVNHPIKEFVAAGVPVTLNTDDPVRVATTIGREYAIAAQLGFSSSALLGFTRNALRAAFLSEAERERLLAVIERQSEAEGTGLCDGVGGSVGG